MLANSVPFIPLRCICMRRSMGVGGRESSSNVPFVVSRSSFVAKGTWDAHANNNRFIFKASECHGNPASDGRSFALFTQTSILATEIWEERETCPRVPSVSSYNRPCVVFLHATCGARSKARRSWYDEGRSFFPSGCVCRTEPDLRRRSKGSNLGAGSRTRRSRGGEEGFPVRAALCGRGLHYGYHGRGILDRFMPPYVTY